MIVREWMSTPAVATSPFMPARAALEFMERHGLRQLAVVEAGRLRGVVFSRDLRARLRRNACSSDAPVESLLSPRPVIVSPADELEVVAGVMLDRELESVTVCEAGKPVGILTMRQVLRALCHTLGIAADEAPIRLSVRDSEDPIAAVARTVNIPAVKRLTTWRNSAAGCWEVVLHARR